MNEEWKGVIYQGKYFGDYYEVSNLGNFRSAKTKKLLKLHLVNSYYLGYCGSLGARNKRKMFKVHRAVAETFIPNLDSKPQINHIDGNKLNNTVGNLEWVTSQENVKHAYATGLISTDSIDSGHLKISKAVIRIDKQQNKKYYDSTRQAARDVIKVPEHESGVASKISACCRGTRKTCCGYRWEYAD